jgi:hypothetical protein
MKRTLIVLDFLDELKARDGWISEAHLHSAYYLLQALFENVRDYRFFLYRRNIMAFDLTDDLKGMRADNFIDSRVNEYPLKPALSITASGHRFKRRYESTLDPAMVPLMDFVTSTLENRSHVEGERLALAFYLKNSCPEVDTDSLHRKLMEVIPGLKEEEAQETLREMGVILEESRYIPVPA